MEREEAIKELTSHLEHWKRMKHEHIMPADECDNTINALRMAIEALSEPINCVKCKHYYETEDDTGVHGYCKIDTAHTNLISQEEAIEMLKALNMMLRSPDGKPISDVCDALDMAIEALQFVKHFDLLKEFQSLQEVVRCKDCRFCANYTDGHRECRLLKNLKTVPCTYVLVDGNDYCSHGERREP